MIVLLHMLAGIGSLAVLCATYYWIVAMCAVFSSKKFAKKLADEVKSREEANKKMLEDLVMKSVKVVVANQFKGSI
jgi:hypothetical protein